MSSYDMFSDPNALPMSGALTALCVACVLAGLRVRGLRLPSRVTVYNARKTWLRMIMERAHGMLFPRQS